MILNRGELNAWVNSFASAAVLMKFVSSGASGSSKGHVPVLGAFDRIPEGGGRPCPRLRAGHPGQQRSAVWANPRPRMVPAEVREQSTSSTK
jgi:hypothetical protein